MSFSAMAWARKQVTGSPSRKSLLLAIANYADEDGAAWPSQARLAQDTELSERSVIRVLQELEDAGFLTRTRRSSPAGRRTDVVQLCVGQPATVAGCSTDKQPAMVAGRTQPATMTPQPDTMSGKPFIEPTFTVATATVESPPDYDKLLFEEGRKIATGSMIAKLKKVHSGDPVAALEVVRAAAGRSDPLAYLSAALRDQEKRNDRGRSHFDAIDEASRRANDYFDAIGIPKLQRG